MHKETVDVLCLEVVGVGRLDFHYPPFHCIFQDHLERHLQQLFLVFQFFRHQRSVVCYQTVEYLTHEAIVARRCG